jgi:hypothetical protein
MVSVGVSRVQETGWVSSLREAAGARREKELDAIRDRLGDKVRDYEHALSLPLLIL